MLFIPKLFIIFAMSITSINIILSYDQRRIFQLAHGGGEDI